MTIQSDSCQFRVAGRDYRLTLEALGQPAEADDPVFAMLHTHVPAFLGAQDDAKARAKTKENPETADPATE